MKYFGLNHKSGPIDFPSPDYPACGYGPKYVIGIEGKKAFFVYKSGKVEPYEDGAKTVNYMVKTKVWAEVKESPYKK